MDDINNTKQNNKNKNNIKQIKASDDIEINGRIYCLPDKYIENKFLSYEYKKLYKLLLVIYIDLKITTYKIENIKSITKTHITNGISVVDKLISYIFSGKLYISHLTELEQTILNNIPQELIQKINLNIIEKIN